MERGDDPHSNIDLYCPPTFSSIGRDFFSEPFTGHRRSGQSRLRSRWVVGGGRFPEGGQGGTGPTVLPTSKR